MDSFDRYLALLKARPGLVENPKGGIVVVSDRVEVARIEAVMSDRLDRRGQPRQWARVGIMYEDPYIRLLRDAVIFPDGTPGLYHRVIAWKDEPTGVAILPRFRDKIVLIRQFRHPSRRWHVEIPRGAIDEDEEPAHVAGVEISEEIGGTISRLVRLGLMHGASALMRHSVVLVYAELESIGTPALGEGIAEILLVSPAELEGMILNGTVTDSFTIGATFHAKMRNLL